jgi:L-fucose isomerase and related proteins
MRKIGLIKLRSVMSQSDPTLNESEENFLQAIDPEKEFLFGKPKDGLLNLFFIETGGSEIYFKDLYTHYPEPYYLLVQGERNSLASSLEILSFLHEKGLEGHLLMGTGAEIHHQIDLYTRAYEAKLALKGTRLGVIGNPSDWLIASSVDYKAVQRKFGIELVNIPMKEMMALISAHMIADEESLAKFMKKTRRTEDLRESFYIHAALKELVKKYKLSGFTLRCFDLVKKLQETSCLAFGLLNAEGIVAACEGDVPSLLSMVLLKTLTGQSVFMANPARIYPETKEAVYAHCTCPFDMITAYTLPTHFESNTGFGIQGTFKKSPFTAAKLKADLSDFRILSGQIVENLKETHLCRSQIHVKFKQPIESLIEEPYGNHLLFTYGDYEELLHTFWKIMNPTH